MCAGNFSGSPTQESADEPAQQRQVALAGNNGAIYVMDSYKVLNNGETVMPNYGGSAISLSM